MRFNFRDKISFLSVIHYFKLEKGDGALVLGSIWLYGYTDKNAK